MIKQNCKTNGPCKVKRTATELRACKVHRTKLDNGLTLTFYSSNHLFFRDQKSRTKL